MFNIGAGEMALIAVVALLVLGPKRLPELARGLGKFMREFRRQTEEVRGVVEREFYRMDQDVTSEPAPSILPAQGIVATDAQADLPLPPIAEVTHSQAMMPQSSPVPAETPSDAAAALPPNPGKLS